MKFLKILICASFAVLFIAPNAFAAFKEGDSAVQFDVGFSAGGIALGAEYEYGTHRTHGIGGYVRIFPEDNDANAAGITVIGGFIRPHFNRQNWDFYISPGFGIYMYELSVVDETLIGPSLATGLLYEISNKFSVGIENLKLYSWFGEDTLRGAIHDSLLAKFRMMF